MISVDDLPMAPVSDADATAFAQRFVSGGPEFLAACLPEQFWVAMPSMKTVISRDEFIAAAIRRAELVANANLPAPELIDATWRPLGVYGIVTAQWKMTINGKDSVLTEDFLVDPDRPTWQVLAYLLRQDLPGLVTGQGHSRISHS